MREKAKCKACGAEKEPRVIVEISKVDKGFEDHGPISVLFKINEEFVAGGVYTEAEFLERLYSYLESIDIKLKRK